jgi:hypothetical protein
MYLTDAQFDAIREEPFRVKHDPPTPDHIDRMWAEAETKDGFISALNPFRWDGSPPRWFLHKPAWKRA